MRVIIIGLGTQGSKRKKILIKKKSYICSYDPINKAAEEKKLSSLKKYNYDTVFLCCPDNFKKKYILYFLKKKKHILVEKPLRLSNKFLKKIERISNRNKIFFYIAYNHRFEPHFKNIKKKLSKKAIGKIYLINFYYGNGTAKLVNKSWRQKKLAITEDIGSHLIDICYFWLEKKIDRVEKVYLEKLENDSNDYGIIILKLSNIVIKFELTYCSWKNSFNCKIVGSKGSIVMNGLCKWGQSVLDNQIRVFPSGNPKSKKIFCKMHDPTWEEEINFFYDNIKKNKKVDLKKEIYLNKLIDKININEKI